MNEPRPNYESLINHHRWTFIIAVNIILLMIIIIIGEIIARQFVSHSLNYYDGMRDRGPGIYQMPYGEIRWNSLGYPDDEFDLTSTKPRIGYVGDSVNFGKGAGYGNRVSELVEAAYPEFEHWNVGAGVGTGIQHQHMVSKATEFRLDTIIYLLNMNDLAQVDNSGEPRDQTWVTVGKQIVAGSLDYFRDKSYLYNWARLTIKNVLYRAGYDHEGRRSVELWPSEHGADIATMCDLLNEAKAELKSLGSDLCVILLPYEMQISREAAEIYRSLGFTWEEAFEEGATQAELRACIGFSSVYDPLPVFDRETAQIGEYFVYNKGDAIDWNHPTAAGHRKIAEGFVASGNCPILNIGDATAWHELTGR